MSPPTSPFVRALHALLLASASAAFPSPAATHAQQPGPADAAEPIPFLTDLRLRSVTDSRCELAAFVSSPAPDRERAEAALETLLGPAAGAASKGAYAWVLWFPTSAGGVPGDTLASRVYRRSDARPVRGERLYEAERLRIVVLLPRPVPGSAAPGYAVRAGTAVRREESLLARGFPGFLGEILGGLAAREIVPGCAPPFPVFDVAVHSTDLGVRDATLAARVDVDASPPLDAARSGLALEAFRRARVDVETRWIGYTALGPIFDAIESALAGEGCHSGAADGCLLAARAAALEKVSGLGLTAQHAITAVRTGTQEALQTVEEVLAARHVEAARTFQVVDRPTIGFSVGGILAEGRGEKLKFDVEDGRVVAEGIEGDGFKALALVDLYFRRVDIGESSPGMIPHASVGFAIGDKLRPGVFLGTTLPWTAGRLALFGGGVLRKETTSDLPAGTEVEPGTEPIRERYAFPLVAGLKVGLPLP